MVMGPDPKPQKQYKYSREAEERIKPTILEQGVLVEMDSVCNSHIACPKSGQIHLEID